MLRVAIRIDIGSIVALPTVTSMALQEPSSLSRSVAGAGDIGPDVAFRIGIRGIMEFVSLVLSVGGIQNDPGFTLTAVVFINGSDVER